MIFNRESTIGLLTALLLTFTAWTWGGVILWTQWTTAALGLLTLALALFPSSASPLSTTTSSSRPATLPLLLSALLGLLTFLGVAGFDLWSTLSLRDATLLLIPSATLPPLTFSDWGLRASLIGLFSALLVPIIFGLIKPSERRRRLLRFWPFWLGLFLFAWITCQSLNPWGKVIQRDLFWHIIPQSHITWLPSGLDAPFSSSEEPGGMNGWRQLLIFIGPWALLCALTISIQRRRVFGWLALVACLNGLGVALAGNLARLNKWRDFLGISDPDLNSAPFGPFIYKNHAGAYLYLVAALTLALMFYLAKRRGEKADRGGPHLVAALGAVALVLGAASTLSIGATITAAVLLLVIAPLAYFFDRQLRTNLSAIPLVAMVALMGVVAYMGLASADARTWRSKIGQKQQRIEQKGDDDRAPLRRATWLMIEGASLNRQLSGLGAGSYRWISPSYMSTQPEYLNRSGNLNSRVTHAHNDWLQAPVEWGAAGWVVIGGTLTFFATLFWSLIRNPRATSAVLLGALVLFSSHAFLDFLLFIPHLCIIAILIAWIRLPDTDSTSR